MEVGWGGAGGHRSLNFGYFIAIFFFIKRALILQQDVCLQPIITIQRAEASARAPSHCSYFLEEDEEGEEEGEEEDYDDDDGDEKEGGEEEQEEKLCRVTFYVFVV